MNRRMIINLSKERAKQKNSRSKIKTFWKVIGSEVNFTLS